MFYLGVVSTARLTHATPAALYAHTCNRAWECDSILTLDIGNFTLAPDEDLHDIAYQFAKGDVGPKLKVALAGGYPAFFPKDMKETLASRVSFINGVSFI